MNFKACMPVSVLCVLINNNDINLINEFIKKNKSCWYPFGNRAKKINEICEYLYQENMFTRDICEKYILYSSHEKDFLIFYLHKSRSQKGSATIDKILLVNKILISKNKAIKIQDKNKNSIPTRDVSKIWLYIKKVELIETLDASSLIKHHLFTEQKFEDKIYHYQHCPDGHKLYKSVIPIKENIKNKGTQSNSE